MYRMSGPLVRVVAPLWLLLGGICGAFGQSSPAVLVPEPGYLPKVGDRAVLFSLDTQKIPSDLWCARTSQDCRDYLNNLFTEPGGKTNLAQPLPESSKVLLIPPKTEVEVVSRETHEVPGTKTGGEPIRCTFFGVKIQAGPHQGETLYTLDFHITRLSEPSLVSRDVPPLGDGGDLDLAPLPTNRSSESAPATTPITLETLNAASDAPSQHSNVNEPKGVPNQAAAPRSIELELASETTAPSPELPLPSATTSDAPGLDDQTALPPAVAAPNSVGQEQPPLVSVVESNPDEAQATQEPLKPESLPVIPQATMPTAESTRQENGLSLEALPPADTTGTEAPAAGKEPVANQPMPPPSLPPLDEVRGLQSEPATLPSPVEAGLPAESVNPSVTAERISEADVPPADPDQARQPAPIQPQEGEPTISGGLRLESQRPQGLFMRAPEPPTSPESMLEKAKQKESEGKTMEAIVAYRALERAHPNSQEGRVATERSREIGEKQRLQAQETSASVVLKRAQELAAGGQTKVAVAYYQQIIKVYPKTNTAEVARKQVQTLQAQSQNQNAAKP